MTDSPETGLVTMLAIVGGLGLLIGIAVYVWYALALSRLFPRIGGEGWKGWVPVLNEAEILARGGVPAWSVVFYFIPIVQLYGLYLKVVATHRINGRFGRGAGMTVLAILLPPVWATVLAWGAAPYPEGERLAALQPGPRRTTPPSASPARDASGYTIPSLAPHTAAPAEPPALVFPDYAAPPRPTQPSESPAAEGAAPAAAAPSVWGAPPQPPVAGAPVAPGAPAESFAPPTVAPPTFAPPTFAPPPADVTPAPASPAPAEHAAPAVPPQPFAPQPPAFVAPPSPSPAQPQPPVASAPPVAPTAVPLPHVSSDAPQFSGHAEFDVYANDPGRVASPTEGREPGSDDAHPTTGIMAAMGGAPSSAPAPSAPAPSPQAAAASAPEPFAPVPPSPASDDPAPASDGPLEQPVRAVRPVPPSFRDTGAVDAAPPAPSIRPAPMPSTEQPPASAESAAPIGMPAPVAPPAGPDAGLAGDVDKTVVTPRPTDDDLDATVVVARKRGVRRSLVLDDGRTFALSGASVVIGRNPMGDPGEQRLAITDTTRTLSKTHARLVVHDDEWRLTDLHATNGVVVVEENGTETLLDPGESVTGNGRFILGEVGMHVVAERDS